ncbi:hypothetical protein [Gorillibacterium timonense]|uniref:hypothetical protein n=1 Tax=Gorillibacterium timonense TaxID=1689269 RepID=UPI00071D34C1|nr:hypothetical protein [Gorillibacterium timonense]
MSIQQAGQTEQVLYQADSSTVNTIKATRDRLHQVCKQYVNHLIRVQTLDGDVFEGILLGCSNGVLFLRQSGAVAVHRFMPYSASSDILTLVLFELLVITLLI